MQGPSYDVTLDGEILRIDVLEAWEEGVEAGHRAVDLFMTDIVSGELGTSDIADLAGLEIAVDFDEDPAVSAFANGFLDVVDDAVLKNRPTA